MDHASLSSVYERILELAASGDFAGRQDEGGWNAELVLAHITVNDDLLIEAVRAVLANKPTPHYDNAAAIDEDNLRGQGTLPELVDKLRTSSRQVCDLASQLGPLEDTPVVTTIRDGDQLHMNGDPMPIGRLLEIHALVHLPSHLFQLEGLRS